MSNPATIDPKSAPAPARFRPWLVLLLCLHIAACCISLIYAAEGFPGIVGFDKIHLFAAILNVSAFAIVAVLFTASRFSFGYFVGFYLYTMIVGYLWLVAFSLLPYNHSLAIVSIFLSALAFLAPALFITSPLRQGFELSAWAFDALLSCLLALAAATVAAGAYHHFRLVDLSEIYKFRAEIEFPTLLRYAIGIASNALLPFTLACFVARRDPWRAAIALMLMLLFYPVTLTRLTLFAPLWLLFLALLSKLAEARIAVILSLLLPLAGGVVIMLLTRDGVIPSTLGMQYFGTINSRMIAMPSVAIEVYNNFFSTHELTHFCQINLLKPLIPCPYGEPLSVIMKVYQLGNFNASLFATEGIASVGPALAPLSAFGCGLVIALGNRVSSGLPPRFVLISGGMMAQVLLNVPLSTALLTNGAAVLFLLWYVTPRAMFEQGRREEPGDA